MVLGNVLISPDTRANLGPEGVAELTAADDGLARQITSAMREGRMLCGWVAL